MSVYKISQGKAASFLHGYGSKGIISGSVSVPTFTFFSGAQNTFTLTLPNTTGTAGLNTMIRFNGTGIANLDNRWLPVTGAVFIRRSAPSYDIQVSLVRDTSKVSILITFYNSTVSSNQTVPNITVDVKALLFAPPW